MLLQIHPFQFYFLGDLPLFPTLVFCLFLPAACFVHPGEYCQPQILDALLVEKLGKF